MLIRSVRSLLTMVILSLIYPVSYVFSQHAVEEKIFPEFTLELKQPRYLVPTSKNGLWIAFVSSNYDIFLQDISKKKKILINPGPGQEKNPSEIVWCESNDKLHFAWRLKSQSKSLEFASLDLATGQLGEKITVDKSSEPMPRIKMGCRDNTINLVWYGERGDERGKKYSIYASRSRDGGKTFSQAFEVTPQTRASLYPTLITDEKGNAYVFTEVVTSDKHKMLFRKATDKGWEEPVIIGEVGTVSLYIRPLKVGNRLLVFWFNSYDGVPVTEMALSDDDGKTWKRYTFEATRNLDLTGMQVVAGDENNIYLVLSAVNLKEKNDDPQKAKDQLFFFYSHDGGKTFSSPVSIRHDQFGSYTRAHLPNILAKGKNVVVVWNDYRNIRANLYMNYSTDGGITWQAKDIPLEEPGKYNTVLHWDIDNLIEYKGAYYILAHRFRDDAMEAAYPVVISFKITK
ncbi:MAG: glycoside hydrolase [Syntrophobacterales bacterium]|nr:glycoside hydrolase [Syntrophobacterales bacterium]